MPYDVTASLSTWAPVFSVCFSSKSTRFARITGHDYRHAALFDLKSWCLPTPVIIILFFKIFIWLPWSWGTGIVVLTDPRKCHCMSGGPKKSITHPSAFILWLSRDEPFAVGRTLKSTYYLYYYSFYGWPMLSCLLSAFERRQQFFFLFFFRISFRLQGWPTWVPSLDLSYNLLITYC